MTTLSHSASVQYKWCTKLKRSLMVTGPSLVTITMFEAGTLSVTSGRPPIRPLILQLTVCYICYKRPQTATPVFIKVQLTGKNQQIFLNAKNIFKLGAIFRENAQRVQKFILIGLAKAPLLLPHQMKLGRTMKPKCV